MVMGSHIEIESTPRRVASHAAEGLRQAAFDLISDNKIEPGFYKMQLATRSVWSPVRIWRGFGWEIGGFHFREVMVDWRALLNGVVVPLRRVWPACAWEPITMGEYRFLLAMRRYARRHAPQLPEARPYQRIDFASLPPRDYGGAR